MLWFWNVKMGNERKTEPKKNLNGEIPKLPEQKGIIHYKKDH